MKLELISFEKRIATVRWIPNRLWRFFGVKEETETYYYNGETYWIDDARIWYCGKSAKQIGRFKRLDNIIDTNSIKEKINLLNKQ
jgi:hypothetical protein